MLQTQNFVYSPHFTHFFANRKMNNILWNQSFSKGFGRSLILIDLHETLWPAQKLIVFIWLKLLMHVSSLLSLLCTVYSLIHYKEKFWWQTKVLDAITEFYFWIWNTFHLISVCNVALKCRLKVNNIEKNTSVVFK